MTTKAQKNPGFTTADLLGLITLVGIVGSIFGAILAQAMQDDRPVRARVMAEGLAKEIRSHQMRATPMATSQNGSRRGPASAQTAPLPLLTAGDMGRDPWGHPYHYLVRKDTEGKAQTVKILVWSDGPNEKPETESTTFDSKPLARQHLSGDDIGFVEEFADL